MPLSRLLAIVLVFSGATAFSASPPREESIRELLTLTRAQAASTELTATVERKIREKVDEIVAERDLSPEVHQIMASMRDRMTPIFQEAVSWKHMEPLYVAAYQEGFTQKEIDAMVSFFRSRAGQAMLDKSPGIGQRIADRTFEHLWSKLEVIQEEVVAELEAQLEKEANKAVDPTPDSAPRDSGGSPED